MEPDRPLVEAVDRASIAAARLRSAAERADGPNPNGDVLALVGVVGLELALAGVELDLASATTADELSSALRDAGAAAREWITDPAVGARLAAMGSREHERSVRLRIEGAASEADRAATGIDASSDASVEQLRATATSLIRRMRQACFVAALSIVV